MCAHNFWVTHMVFMIIVSKQGFLSQIASSRSMKEVEKGNDFVNMICSVPRVSSSNLPYLVHGTNIGIHSKDNKYLCLVF